VIEKQQPRCQNLMGVAVPEIVRFNLHEWVPEEPDSQRIVTIDGKDFLVEPEIWDLMYALATNQNQGARTWQ